MPEIVEVQIIAEQLEKEILYDSIVKVEFSNEESTSIIQPLTNQEFAKEVENRRVYDVYRIGKKIIFDLGERYMVSSLMMTGRWLLDVPEEQIGHTRVTFHLKSGKILRYSDVRKFGTLKIMDLNEVNKLSKGLDIWDVPEEVLVYNLFENHIAFNKTIKQLILNQDVLSGLGNIYACEVLRKAKIHPAEFASSVLFNKERTQLLVKAIKEKIQEGYERGGLSVKDYYHLDGRKGDMQNHLVVYKQEYCSCGTKVERNIFSDKRTSYYCPNCQRS